MQKGFAMLEIIFAMVIITVLLKSAVPNAFKIIDRVSLDYEVKRFYSELRFVQSNGRTSTISNVGTGSTGIIVDNVNKPTLFIRPKENYYQILRGMNNDAPAIRERHYFSNGVTIKFRENATLIRINFDSIGKVNIYSNETSSNKERTFILTSRLGKQRKIIFDNVGRIRGE